MNKKKRMQKKSCESKRTYRSKYDATNAVNATLRRHFIFHRLKPYKCIHCHKWHIGKTNEIVYKRFKELVK